MTKPSLLLLALFSLCLGSCDSESSAGQAPKEKPTADHRSTATLQIHYTRPFEPDAPAEPAENFLNNQIAILTTNNIIEEAAKLAVLEPEIVRKALWVEPIQNTDLITLSAFHDDKDTAKRIAESVITTYITQRDRLEQSRAKIALDALDFELVDQGDLVQDYRRALTVLIQQYGIPYFEGRGPNPVGLTEEELYRSAQKKLDELEIQRDQLEIQTKKLLNLSDEDSIQTAIGFDLPNNTNQISKYYTTYRRHIELAHQKMATGLGKEHPSVIADQKQADQALKTALIEVASIKEILKTRLALLDQQVEKMKESVGRKKGHTVDLSMQQHQYNRAKEEYEQAREMYREMKIKQQESRVMLKMPRTPITIHGWSHQ